MRNKKRYKDIMATFILLGVAGFMYGLYYFALNSTQHQKNMVIYGLVGVLVCVAILAVWTLIRIVID